MTEPPKSEPSNTFNVTGYNSQMAVGSPNSTFYQHNLLGEHTAGEEFRRILEEIQQRLDELSDREQAHQQLIVIKQELDRKAAEKDKNKVQQAIDKLLTLVTSGSNLAEAIQKAALIVARYWPF